MLVSDAELVAVASTNQERAKAFGATYGVANCYATYEALYKDANVDIIYVASLHHTHASISIAAMNHKKHVLCEKPIAINAHDAKQMIASSIKNEVFLMEAFWSRFNPSINKVLELIQEGKLGRLRYINADFSFYMLDAGDESRALNLELAGGSLLDVGIYPVFLSYLLLGMPTQISASSSFYHTGAEIQTAMILEYPGAQAVLFSGFTTDSEMKAKIGGEKGSILIDPNWHETESFQFIKDKVATKYKLPKKGKGYVHEILEVHACIRNKQIESKKWSHQNSIELISILDTIRMKAGIHYPFEIK
jgi:predicted dehydrogenase